jgi:hypothetical protein
MNNQKKSSILNDNSFSADSSAESCKQKNDLLTTKMQHHRMRRVMKLKINLNFTYKV